MHQSLELKENTVVSQCREMIQEGSKSFSLSSYLFNTEKRNAAHMIYAWCRYCDDQIDQAENKHVAQKRLDVLFEKTRSCYEGKKQDDFIFYSFQLTVQKYNIPIEYPLELLYGMQMDLTQNRYQNIEELKLYCFRVASTVGLMMTHVMGIKDEKALKNAVDLGMAMQMTNIARDVLDDYHLGRIYLPLDWLKEEGICEDNFAAPVNRAKVYKVTERLLNEADLYYRSGNEGISYLPFRAALAVKSASLIYSDIGSVVRKRKEKAWDCRAFVSLPRKLWLVAKSCFKLSLTVPSRMMNRQIVKITKVWRHV